MVMHYSVGNGHVACGRNDHNVTATPQREHVTCQSCLRSERYTSTPALQFSARSDVLERAAYKWRLAWAEKALTERPRDRLPRGMKRTSCLR